MTAQEAQNQRAFSGKQQRQAKEEASRQRERVLAPANVQAQDDRLDKAAKHRADVERRNAERDKPRAAPLPPP